MQLGLYSYLCRYEYGVCVSFFTIQLPDFEEGGYLRNGATSCGGGGRLLIAEKKEKLQNSRAALY